MAFLQKSDFANGKAASMGPYAGKTRHEIVESKIKDKKDFFLGDKGTEGKVKGIKYDSKTMMFTFEYLSGKNKGKEETTKIIGAAGEKIFKDPDFGSGGGAGGGTLQTAYAESLQCVWIIACLKNPRKKFEDFTEKDLKAAFDDSRCQVGGTPFKKMMGVDSSWNKSGFDSAKKLISDGYVNKDHAIHRDSKLMNDIYDHKKKAFVNTGLRNLNNDKWNPGDIWAIDKNFKINELDNSTIKAYNDSLIENFNSKRVVGISLKKVQRGNAKIKEYNLTNKRPQGLKYKEGKLESSTGNFFTSKDGIIVFQGSAGSSAKMNIKVNKDFGTHKVEIILTTARGGGAGWGVIQDIVEEVLGPSQALPDNSEYQRRTKKILEQNQTEINRFWNLARESGYGSKYSKSAFIEKLLEKNKFWIHAKYGALSLIARLDSTTKTKANKIVNKINNYAGSQSDLSSVYIKVYE